MIKAKKKINLISFFKCILCIYYLIYFKKNLTKIKALLDFDSEVNSMTSTYVTKLDFKI